jgi:hypothetical protein
VRKVGSEFMGGGTRAMYYYNSNGWDYIEMRDDKIHQ